ncbi:MAG TPA: hypothetical protein IAA24_07015 [Candidatus Eubacterium faecigallinarum]|nr:hypothetical protein [Candidatus Eubacterium faecigallinarum]
MWLSKKMVSKESTPAVQSGISTLNSNGKVEAISTGAERDIRFYSAYGYSFSIPSGEEILMSQSSGQQTAFGTLMKNSDIETGEIMITSQSGAYIHLKNNGSVVINGLEIDKNGVIVNE